MTRHEKLGLHDNLLRILVPTLLLVTLLASTCCAKAVADDTRRIKQGSSKDIEARGANSAEESHHDAAEAESRRREERDARADLRYTDQDEKSSLYDDYEAKDVAKRGVPGNSEDYVEAEEDTAQEQSSAADEVERAKARSDARIKRDEAGSKARLDEPKVAEDPHARQASGGLSEIEEPANAAASCSKDTASPYAEYERRAEQQIQRKIDLIKDEIRRDIEARRRLRQIRENNARFDELQRENQEHEDEEDESSRSRKRDSVAKRSVPAASLRSDVNRRSPRSQRRGSVNKTVIGKSHASSAKKEKRVSETTRSRKRRSHGSPSAARDVESRVPANDGMAAPPLTSGFAEEKQISLGRFEPDDSSALLAGSSPELEPRSAKDYREAFGGLQSESGSSLARFKRIKRVLADPDDERISKLR